MVHTGMRQGKIIELYTKKSISGIIIPIFKIKTPTGEILEVGRGMLSVKTFGKDYMNKSVDEMEEFSKKPHYGLKKGQTIYLSDQENWD